MRYIDKFSKKGGSTGVFNTEGMTRFCGWAILFLPVLGWLCSKLLKG